MGNAVDWLKEQTVLGDVSDWVGDQGLEIPAYIAMAVAARYGMKALSTGEEAVKTQGKQRTADLSMATGSPEQVTKGLTEGGIDTLSTTVGLGGGLEVTEFTRPSQKGGYLGELKEFIKSDLIPGAMKLSLGNAINKAFQEDAPTTRKTTTTQSTTFPDRPMPKLTLGGYTAPSRGERPAATGSTLASGGGGGRPQVRASAGAPVRIKSMREIGDNVLANVVKTAPLNQKGAIQKRYYAHLQRMGRGAG